MKPSTPPDVPRWKTFVGIILVIGAAAAAISLITKVVSIVFR